MIFEKSGGDRVDCYDIVFMRLACGYNAYKCGEDESDGNIRFDCGIYAVADCC